MSEGEESYPSSTTWRGFALGVLAIIAAAVCVVVLTLGVIGYHTSTHRERERRYTACSQVEGSLERTVCIRGLR